MKKGNIYNIFKKCTFIVTIIFSICCCSNKNIENMQKEISLKSFSVAIFDEICNLLLIQDTCYKIVFEGDEDIIQNIELLIKDDTLTVNGARTRMLSIEEIPSIALHFENLTRLFTLKPANVKNADTLKLDNFYYIPIGEIGEAELTVDCNVFGLHNSANTLGRFFIKGKSNYLNLFNRYGCSIFADSLLCSVSQVNNESVGDVYVNASQELRVYIWGTGNIFYYGNPKTEVVERRNSGQLLKLK